MPQPLGCRVCGTVVPLTVSKTNPNRYYQPECCSSTCKKAHLKTYYKQWCAENKHKVKARKDEIRDQVRACDKKFYARHRERRKGLRRERYKSNPEKHLAAARKYATEHPEVIRRIGRKNSNTRRARVKGAFVEVVDPMAVFERDKGICGICRLPVDVQSGFEVDHVIPLSKGGSHGYENVQIAHRRCNRSKGANVPESSER